MKQIKKLMLLLAVMLLLCSCGQQSAGGSAASPNSNRPVSGNKKAGPGEDQLLADMQESLSLYHAGIYGYDVPISEYEIERSLTEDNCYSAQINVTANSVYAKFNYVASVSYTHYDQGWGLDLCDWELNGWQIVNFPEEEKITGWYLNRVAKSSSPDVAERISLEESATITTTTYENGDISCMGKVPFEWNDAFLTQARLCVTWAYDPYTDYWVLSNEESDEVSCTPTKELEGIYELTPSGWGDVTISNVTDSGFNIQIETRSYNTDTIYVSLDDDSLSLDTDNWFIGVRFNIEDVPIFSTHTGDASVRIKVMDNHKVQLIIHLDGKDDEGERWEDYIQADFE